MRLALVLTAAVSLSGASSLAAQIALAACPAPQIIGDLGIDGLECQGCEIHGRPRRDESWIRFNGEPRIHSVRPTGPSAGHLEAGDVIVTIDSLPIISRAGSDRYSRLKPDQPVHLVVRRDGQLVEVRVTAAPICGAPSSRYAVRRGVPIT